MVTNFAGRRRELNIEVSRGREATEPGAHTKGPHKALAQLGLHNRVSGPSILNDLPVLCGQARISIRHRSWKLEIGGRKGGRESGRMGGSEGGREEGGLEGGMNNSLHGISAFDVHLREGNVPHITDFYHRSATIFHAVCPCSALWGHSARRGQGGAI